MKKDVDGLVWLNNEASPSVKKMILFPQWASELIHGGNPTPTAITISGKIVAIDGGGIWHELASGE